MASSSVWLWIVLADFQVVWDCFGWFLAGCGWFHVCCFVVTVPFTISILHEMLITMKSIIYYCI